jgi:hypothetical protein
MRSYDYGPWSGTINSPGPDSPSRNITISDCTFLHGHGLSVGSELAGGAQNIRAERVHIEGTNNGIRIKANRDRGNDVSNLVFRDIEMKDQPAVVHHPCEVRPQARVADGPPDIGAVSLGFMGILHGFQSWQMFEARIILESNLAALAAERRREKHHPALAEEVAEMFAGLDAPAEYLVHDVLFHRIIAQASGNPILAAIMETVTSSMYDKRRKTVERVTDLRESAEMHCEIYRAIRARNPQDARKLMEEHLPMAQAAQGIERPGERKTPTRPRKDGRNQVIL